MISPGSDRGVAAHALLGRHLSSLSIRCAHNGLLAVRCDCNWLFRGIYEQLCAKAVGGHMISCDP